eukprot:1201189-Amorphochlora_amoeboformis.AAC.1
MNPLWQNGRVSAKVRGLRWTEYFTHPDSNTCTCAILGESTETSPLALPQPHAKLTPNPKPNLKPNLKPKPKRKRKPIERSSQFPRRFIFHVEHPTKPLAGGRVGV